MQGKPDQPQTPRVAIALVVLCCVYGLTNLRGCQSGPIYYKITGVVRVAGEPAEGIQVNFNSDDPNKPLASGLTDSKGWFALYSGVSAIEGCQEGGAKVTFVAIDIGGGGGGEGGRGRAGGRGRQGGRGEGRGEGGPGTGVSSNGLQLPPDMPIPPFALEYSSTMTTPIHYDVTKDAEVEFDLLEFGSTEVPPPRARNSANRKKQDTPKSSP